MPVLNKEKRDKIEKELRVRFEILLDNLSPRKLHNNREGCGRNFTWSNPDEMTATVGEKMSLSLAVEDFKSMLAEIKKLK